MRNRPLILFALISAFLITSASSWAHHSTAMFDLGKVVTYRGTITKIVWANPHCFIYFDGVLENGPANAPAEHWGVEGQSPSVMVSHGGWEEETAKVGDQITVSGNPRRDGIKEMLLMDAIIGGKKFQVMARQSQSSNKK